MRWLFLSARQRPNVELQRAGHADLVARASGASAVTGKFGVAVGGEAA
jgi:hypothetical protein